MNLEEIKDLIKLVSKTGIGRVEIEREGFKVIIKGGMNTQGDQPIYMQQAVPSQQILPAAAPVSMPVTPSAPTNTVEVAPLKLAPF